MLLAQPHVGPCPEHRLDVRHVVSAAETYEHPGGPLSQQELLELQVLFRELHTRCLLAGAQAFPKGLVAADYDDLVGYRQLGGHASREQRRNRRIVLGCVWHVLRRPIPGRILEIRHAVQLLEIRMTEALHSVDPLEVPAQPSLNFIDAIPLKGGKS